MAAKIAVELCLGRVVDKALEARPVARRRGVRQRRHVVEVVVPCRERQKQLVVVELLAIARAVDQRDVSRVALLQQIEQHRLGTRES